MNTFSNQNLNIVYDPQDFANKAMCLNTFQKNKIIKLINPESHLKSQIKVVQNIANGVRLGSLKPNKTSKIEHDPHNQNDTLNASVNKSIKDNKNEQMMSGVNKHNDSSNHREYVQIDEQKIKDRAQSIL